MKKHSRFGSSLRFPGRDGWWCRFRRGGKLLTRYGGRTEAAADRMRSRVWVLVQDGVALEEAVAHVWGEPPPGATRTTFRGLLELYAAAAAGEGVKKASTLRRDQNRANVLRDAPWAKLDVGTFGKPEVRAWVSSRLRAGTSGQTVNNDLSFASAVTKYAQDRGWIEDDGWNPYRGCRVRQVVHKQRPALDLEEFRHFLAAVAEACPDAYGIFLAAGHIG